MSSLKDSAAKNFRQRFCQYYECPDETFPSAALRKFLYFPWSMLAPVVLALFPGLLATDRRIVQQLGLITSRDTLLNEVRGLRMDYLRHRDFGLLRSLFRLRLSGARILQSARIFWGE